MNLLIDFNLWILGIILNVMLVLALIVLRRHHSNSTNNIFAVFILISVVWGIVNYLSFNLANPKLILFLVRLVMFFAIWQAFLFMLLVDAFPKATFFFSKLVKFGVIPVLFLVSFFTLTPYVFLDVILSSSQPPQPIVGPGIVVFALGAISMVGMGMIILIRKLQRAEGIEKIQLLYLLIGVALMFSLIIGFNFLLPIFLNNTSFIVFTPLFVLPFIVATTYAIARHHLFDTRIIATELLTAFLILINFFRIVFSSTLQDLLVNGGVFISITFFGILLIRSVIKEVRQREELARIAIELENANVELEKLDKAKSEFLSIASHQLRTPLTAIKGYISMFLEGSYGKISVGARKRLQNVYEANERLINLINDLLNLSRIESGKIEMKWEDVDVKEVSQSVIQELEIKAKEKKLKLKIVSEEAMAHIHADKAKIRNIIMNIVDNAIRYTEKGSITVALKKLSNPSFLRIEISDTGAGMTPEELQRIFQKFSRGQAGNIMFVGGSGLGLNIAKEFVQLHKGKIWAESQGRDKGSTFIIELPFNSAS